MTLIQPTESVLTCDVCGFAGLVGLRGRDWSPYRMAAVAERWVRFGFCTACGVSCVRPAFGGPLSRQPAPLARRGGAVPVSTWESVPDDSTPGVCPACGETDALLWWVSDPHTRVRCPCCWAGPLRLTDHRASHPGW